MKKRKLVLMAAVPLLMTSCVIYTQNYATGNPVGTKVGTLKAKQKKDFSFGVAQAAKEAGITKIGTVDLKCYMSGKIKVVVTGE